MVKTIAEYQHGLLDHYDVVLVTDVDEIVIPDPAWGTLGEYIDRFDEPFVNAFGYELIDLVDREPPYRSDEPDPWPATLLVRQPQRLQQAGSGIGADAVGPAGFHNRY